MSRFNHRPAFAARRPAKDARTLRGEWVQALELAGQMAGLAEAEGQEARPDFGPRLTRLMVTLRDLEPANFPVSASSAQSMATAFLRLARDFVHPSWSPQARTACAPFLKACATALDRLLTELRTEEGGPRTRQILGEREED